MSRNLRTTPYPSTRPADHVIEPHRYLWAGWDDDFRFKWRELGHKAWREAVPYQEGQTIYIRRNGEAVRALIITIGSEIPEYGPDAGDKREKYRVLYETVRREWSRNWIWVYPGDVQRGYRLAGLAPEMPEDA